MTLRPRVLSGIFIFYLIGCPLSGAEPAASPPTEEQAKALLAQYEAAMKAFLFGDYQNAANTLEDLISKAPPQANLESAYYTLAAAYLNLEQYPKAAEGFKNYVTKFPKGLHYAEALLSMAQAAYLSKDFTEAAADYKALEKFPQYKQQAMLFGGLASKEDGKADEAIATLEQLTAAGLNNNNTVNGAIALAGCYADKGEAEKAKNLLAEISGHINLLDNVTKLNALAVQLGDTLLQQAQQPGEALDCYRMVRTNAEVIQFQTDRIAAIQKQIDQNIADFRANPTHIAVLSANKQLKASLLENQKLLAEFQKLPDFAPALLLRKASCLQQMGETWESIVVYEDFLKLYPQDPSIESAYYGLILASSEARRYARTKELSEEYLKRFPSNPHAYTVGYLLGTTALQANDAPQAESYFGRMLKEQPKSTYREEMLFLLGTSRFAQAKYDEASTTFDQYLSDFPKGAHLEDATYRKALCAIFSGKYEKALGLLQDYVRAFPKGQNLADAKYRIAVCKYSASLYDEVIADCKAWEAQFPEGQMLGEVLSIKADALAANGQDDDAIENYLRAAKVSSEDEVISYALPSAEKLLQKHGSWEKIGSAFEDFVRNKPDNPMVPMALYWVAKAKVHDGKIDEAKQFLAETIRKFLPDPTRNTEPLLTQFAQLCLRKKQPPALTGTNVLASGTGGAPVASGTTAAAVPAAAPAPDPAAELEALLTGPESQGSATARARVIYAQAELARLRKQRPEEEKAFQQIAENFAPADLSPMLLAQVGDYLLNNNQSSKASAYFNQLINFYPKSEVADYAYNGLGEIAYQDKQYDKALDLFVAGIEKADEGQKRKDLSVGKAKCLLALNRLDDAKKEFEQIASTREWRGEATAFSVYSLGKIAQQRNDFPTAIAYYQRVFVAYQRFLPWVAKAYIKSAECFEKLGKTQEAVNTYREMLRNQKLSAFAEYQKAKQHLQELGQGS